MADRLVEGLAYEWRVERSVEVLLLAASEVATRPESAARLQELAASARARRSRLERRLDALRAGRRLSCLPAPIDGMEELLETVLGHARASADRYGVLAELGRRMADPETAFACELNRIGAEESAGVLEVLLGAEVERSVHAATRIAGEPSQPGMA